MVGAPEPPAPAPPYQSGFMTLPPVPLQEHPVVVFFIGDGFGLLVASYG
jgi:hypothetical protein